MDFGRRFTPAPGVEARFTPVRATSSARASSTCELGGRRVVFSGDLGRYDVPIMVDPEPVAEADVLLVESTYGNRVHPADDPADRLDRGGRRAVEQKGWLLIPAFAVGRSQEILYDLRELEKRGAIPSLPVFLDSPMGIQATAIYAAHPEEHDAALAGAWRAAPRPSPRGASRSRARWTTPSGSTTRRAPASSSRAAAWRPAAASSTTSSACCPIPRPRSSSSATRRRARAAGCCATAPARSGCSASTVPVRATIMASDAYSAHADREEILRWLGGFKRPPGITYLVHGEPAAAEALRDAIVSRLGWNAAVAQDGQRVTL